MVHPNLSVPPSRGWTVGPSEDHSVVVGAASDPVVKVSTRDVCGHGECEGTGGYGRDTGTFVGT